MADKEDQSQFKEGKNGKHTLYGASATDDDVAGYTRRWEQSKARNEDSVEKARKVNPALADSVKIMSDLANKGQEATYNHAVDYMKRKAIQDIIKTPTRK